MPSEIQISRKLTNQLLHHAQQNPAVEICGLVGSKNNVPSTCYPVSNVAQHPEKRFQLDASEQIAAMAKMRDSQEQLFAIYHSHPTAPATPSMLDLEQAAYPDALYLIISLNTKGILEMRGFKITNASAVEIPLTLNQD
jgi:proteasome lid subunit RPN8/RPN11